MSKQLNKKQPQITQRFLQAFQLPEIAEELEEFTLDDNDCIEHATTSLTNFQKTNSAEEGHNGVEGQDSMANRKVSDFLSSEENRRGPDDFVTFKFEVGNSIEQTNKVNISSVRRVGRRRVWQFYVQAKARCDLRNFVDKVIIELKSKCETRKSTLIHPFEFSASAELETIPYTIIWKDWTRLSPTTGTHTLSLSKSGTSTISTIEYSAKAYEEHKRRSLKECMR